MLYSDLYILLDTKQHFKHSVPSITLIGYVDYVEKEENCIYVLQQENVFA